MKKITAAFLMLLLAATVTACTSGEDSQPQTQLQIQPNSPDVTDVVASSQEANEQGANEQGKILIAYYSRMGNMNFDSSVDAVASASVQVVGSEYKGNNQVIAELLSEKTGGDVFFIEQEDKYPADYRTTTEQVQEEQSAGVKPALMSHVADIRQYDTVILVYPIWWGTLPPALHTFLEEYDFAGKTILPLATHGGSGLGSSPDEIARLCPGAVVLDGFAVNGESVLDAGEALSDWIDQAEILE